MDAEKNFVAFAPLLGFHDDGVGFVIVGAPLKAVFAKNRALQLGSLAALLLVAVIVMLAAWFGAGRLVLRPIDALIDASRRLSSGELNARLGHAGGSREVAALGAAFDEMASALQARDAALALDIAERRLAEKALARESDRNRALLRNASDGLHILDAEGKGLEVSDSFCRMLGRSREELMGAHMSL